MFYNFETCCLETTRDDIDIAYNAVLSKVFTPDMVEVIENKVRAEIEKARIKYWIDFNGEEIDRLKDSLDMVMTEIGILKEFVVSPEAEIIEEVCNGNHKRLYELRKMIDYDNRFGISMHVAYNPIMDENGNVFDEQFSDAYFEVLNNIPKLSRLEYKFGGYNVIEDLDYAIWYANKTIEEVVYYINKVEELYTELAKLEADNKGNGKGKG